MLARTASTLPKRNAGSKLLERAIRTASGLAKAGVDVAVPASILPPWSPCDAAEGLSLDAGCTIYCSMKDLTPYPHTLAFKRSIRSCVAASPSLGRSTRPISLDDAACWQLRCTAATSTSSSAPRTKTLSCRRQPCRAPQKPRKSRPRSHLTSKIYNKSTTCSHPQNEKQ